MLKIIRLSRRVAVCVFAGAALACGGDDGTDPITVTLGETTFVILVNPIVNDANAVAIPTPGATQSGVNVSVTGGPSGTTNADGVVVLSPVPAGTDTLALNGRHRDDDIVDKVLPRFFNEIYQITLQIRGMKSGR